MSEGRVGGAGGGSEGHQRSSACPEGVVVGAGFVREWQAVTTATCVREALALGEELVLRFEDGRELAVTRVELAVTRVESEVAPSKTRCQEGKRKS